MTKQNFMKWKWLQANAGTPTTATTATTGTSNTPLTPTWTQAQQQQALGPYAPNTVTTSGTGAAIPYYTGIHTGQLSGGSNYGTPNTTWSTVANWPEEKTYWCKKHGEIRTGIDTYFSTHFCEACIRDVLMKLVGEIHEVDPKDPAQQLRRKVWEKRAMKHAEEHETTETPETTEP